MLLLISDANILIDSEVGNFSAHLFQLSYEIAVPDVLFESELQERHVHLLQIGLKLKSLTSQAVQMTEHLSIKYPRPSLLDCMTLALAIQEHCPLLTGDKDLRNAAKMEGIEVHGTIWILEKLLEKKLIDQNQARHSVNQMKNKGSRLPWGEVDKLLDSITLKH